MQTVNRLQFVSSPNKNVPISYKYVENQRIKLKNYQNAKSPSLTNKSSISSTLNFNETQSTFRPIIFANRLLSTEQKLRSQSRNSERQNYEDYLRPQTQLKSRTINGNRDKVHTPLQIINTKMSDSQQNFQLTKVPGSLRRLGTGASFRPKSCSYSHLSPYRSQPKLKQFLKKGTAINKSILLNIFKSKFNQNISGSSYSYTDKNPQLISIISRAIPKPLKDVVGPQQMLKMSRIMTGVKIKSTNIEKNMMKVLAQTQTNKLYQKGRKIQEQDTQTLKSIKRW